MNRELTHKNITGDITSIECDNDTKVSFTFDLIVDIYGSENLVVSVFVPDLGENVIIEMKELEKFVNLQELSLNGSGITEIKGLNNSINLNNIALANNKITEIKGLDKLVNLQKLYLNGNKITELKELENLVNLQELELGQNQITEIKGLDKLVNLRKLLLWDNKIEEIKGLDNLVNLQELNLRCNKIKEIKGLDNLVNLRKLDLDINRIAEIKEINNLINLQELYLYENKIKEINMSILNCRNLLKFGINYDVVINPIIRRFLNRNKIKHNSVTIYNDSQNVHDSSINKSITQSINKLLNDHQNIVNYDQLDDILKDTILTITTKQAILEYVNNGDVHSTLNITFNELLNIVWYIINRNPNKNQIKIILNDEINDSICKCFTGRISRLLNCLNGFDERVNIKISYNSGISNIIVMIKSKPKYVNMNDTLLVELKDEIRKELEERGYERDIIMEWLSYVD